MSELKWNWAYFPYLDPPEGQKETALKAGYIKVVDKSEADKVIAELKAQKAQAEDDCAYWKMNEGNAANAMHETEEYAMQLYKEAQHHKYKRCLTMARWCCEAYDKWMMRKVKAIGIGKDGVEEYHQARRKLFHYMRWQKRWMELAEQFKEAK
jgi:hypothetical protein